MNAEPKKNPPICQDCKFYNSYGQGICMHPDVKGFDPTSGDTHPRAREVRTGVLCGWNGKLFVDRGDKDRIAWPVVLVFVSIFLIALRVLVHVIFGVWLL